MVRHLLTVPTLCLLDLREDLLLLSFGLSQLLLGLLLLLFELGHCQCLADFSILFDEEGHLLIIKSLPHKR